MREYVFSSESKDVSFSSSFILYFIVIFWESTYVTTPSLSAFNSTLESDATWFSKPVPTIGDSGFINGTDWRIMLEPIKALLASSCSKKGINEAEIEAIWLGATSI